MLPVCWLIFPYPTPSYNSAHPNLRYVNATSFVSPVHAWNLLGRPPTPKRFHIPVMLVDRSATSRKLVIHFHGNSEDIGMNLPFAHEIAERLSATVIAVEYPQYGVYKHEAVDPDCVYADALVVYDFCVNQLGYLPRDITVFGVSIGTAPSVYLAANRQIGFLILLAPFLSIKKAGMAFTRLAALAQNVFDSEALLSRVSAPVFVIHGQCDTVVPVEHGAAIAAALRHRVPVCFVSPPAMTHNDYDHDRDLFDPLIAFRRQYELENATSASLPQININALSRANTQSLY